MPKSSPPLAGPRYQDIAGRTEALAKHFSGWEPPPDGSPDPGRALIQVFARMAGQVLERINRIPDRNFLAYLNLIGIEPLPPRPARVPLTFSLVQNTDAEPLVPARTRVGASRQPGDKRELLFETERELATTRARLVAVLVHQTEGDLWADRTQAATGSVPGFYEAFGGEQPVEHSLYLATDDIPHLPAGTALTVSIGFASQVERDVWQELHAREIPLLRWSYWNGVAWHEFKPTAQLGATTWAFTLALPADLMAVAVGGRTARWLRCRLTTWPKAELPALQGLRISASVDSAPLPPDLALVNGSPVDLSMDFYPLGETPRFNDALYLSSDAVFSRPGAKVTVTTSGSEQASQEAVETDVPPVLTWEVSTATGWTKLEQTPKPAVVKPNEALPPTTFTLPTNVAPMEAHGQRAHWLRIRLGKGNFGVGPHIINVPVEPIPQPPPPAPPLPPQPTTQPVVVGSYRPPILKSLSLTYRYTSETAAPTCLTSSDFTVTERTGQGPFVPFTRAQETALYLGFDRPFAPRGTLLYLQVAPLLAGAALPRDSTLLAPPRIVWEYSTGEGWALLGAQDETRGFSRSGLVQFIGPEDFAARPALGRRLHWLRARAETGTFPVMPRLGHVLTNTVWASHAVQLKEELLGSSTGDIHQTFTLSQRPVLEGQRIEVRESEERWVLWSEVPDFHTSGPEDRHYLLDRLTGEVRFGDGQYGRVPPRGVRNVRATEYLTGGGAEGNRPVGALNQLKSTVVYVDAVTNLEPSMGGADPESVEQSRERGPRMLRHRGRAVTAEDFEDLARLASPAVARAKAITPLFNPLDLANTTDRSTITNAGRVEVVIVPFGSHHPPTPSLGLLQEVEAYLRERCAPASRLHVTGPDWIEVGTTVTLVPVTFEGTDALLARVRRALTDFLHPLTGGFDGTGWALGDKPRNSDIYRLVGSLPGVESVRTASVSTSLPVSGRTLVYSGTHILRLAAPQGAR